MISEIIEDFKNCLDAYYTGNFKSSGNICLQFVETYSHVPEIKGFINGNNSSNFDVLFTTDSGNYIIYTVNNLSIVGFYDFNSKSLELSNLFHLYNGKEKLFSFLDKSGEIFIDNKKTTYNIHNINEEIEFYFSLKGKI